jgi:beta-glucosidase
MRDMIQHDGAAWPVNTGVAPQSQSTYTDTGWEVHPQGLTEILVWLKKRYGDIPQYVTENGAAFYDPPKATDGRVNDPLRLHYYRQHLCAIHDAIEQGVDLRGYCAWSLLDNLEWSLGYSKRFGIVHVNFDTQERTLKDSAHFYSKVIATNGAALDTDSHGR